MNNFEKLIEDGKKLQKNDEHHKAAKIFRKAINMAEKENDSNFAKANALLEEASTLEEEKAKSAAKKYRKAANLFHDLGIEGSRNPAKKKMEDLRKKVSLKEREAVQNELLKVKGLEKEEVERGYLKRYQALKLGKKDRFGEAVEFLEEAEKIFKKSSQADRVDIARTKAEKLKHQGYQEMRIFSFDPAKKAFEEAADTYEEIDFKDEKEWCQSWRDVCSFLLTQDREKLEGITEVLQEPEEEFDTFKRGVRHYVNMISTKEETSRQS